MDNKQNNKSDAGKNQQGGKPGQDGQNKQASQQDNKQAQPGEKSGKDHQQGGKK